MMKLLILCVVAKHASKQTKGRREERINTFQTEARSEQ